LYSVYEPTWFARYSSYDANRFHCCQGRPVAIEIHEIVRAKTIEGLYIVDLQVDE
jgi:hypothetical protein